MTIDTKQGCPQLAGICRSPYTCEHFGRCFDRVPPDQEQELLGHGSGEWGQKSRRQRALQAEGGSP